ncbi:NADH dehydrogenase-like [Tropilaelaps mercedesae]|uniref:NADH dehydrogenase-like n=1 Tax=Tropilaelaps mercedesae TaxID=418985 RepID=A0A1V9XH66_9ACAR|nr:NADH dehydrogenase-like [Tropilaelaps mercedesae]
MIGSALRGVAGSAVARPHQLQLAGHLMVQKRHSGGSWYYRDIPPPVEPHIGRGIMCAMWAWITYHCLTDYGHLFGHFPIQDPSTFTDEELGVIRDV